VENFFDPQYLRQFWTQEAEIFVPLEIKEAHFRFEFQDPIHTIGMWGDDRRNKKNLRFLEKWVYFKSSHR